VVERCGDNEEGNERDGGGRDPYSQD
jgi:hypothetical protein